MPRGKKPVKMTDDKATECRALRAADPKAWTLGALAARYGIHYVYAGQIVRGERRKPAGGLDGVAADLASAASAKRADVEAMRARLPAAVRDYRRGLSLRVAAGRHGMHWTTLGRELHRRGVALRAKGGKRHRAGRFAG